MVVVVNSVEERGVRQTEKLREQILEAAERTIEHMVVEIRKTVDGACTFTNEPASQGC